MKTAVYFLLLLAVVKPLGLVYDLGKFGSAKRAAGLPNEIPGRRGFM